MFNYEIEVSNYHPLLQKEIANLKPKMELLKTKFEKKFAYLNKKLAYAKNAQENDSKVTYWEAKIAYHKYKYYLKINKYFQFLVKNNIFAHEEQPNSLPIKWHNQQLTLHGVNFFYTHEAHFPKHILKNLNFSFEAKEISVLMGKTGSGKSTLIQLLNALNRPTTGFLHSGNYYLFSSKNTLNLSQIRSQFGLVFQFPEYQLFANTIQNEILSGLVNLNKNYKNDTQLAKQYLKLVNLPEEYLSRSPFQLSAGQKRRVALASILAMETGTLILDEPTVGLDPEGIEWLISLLLKYKRDKEKRIIVVSHDIDFVYAIADHLYLLDEGQLVKKDTPFKVFNDDQLMEHFLLKKPQVLSFVNKLKSSNIVLENLEVRTIFELVQELKKYHQRKESNA